METLARLESMLGTVSDRIQFLNKTLEGQSLMPIASDDDLETQELIEAGQPRVVFSAIKKSGSDFNGDVLFDEVPIVTNNCFDKNTGTFVAARTAVFVFSVSALSRTSKGTTVISVLKNDNLLMKITDGHDQDNLNNIGFTWIEPMTVGDTLRLSVTGHKLYSNANHFVFFNGFSLVIFRLVLLCNTLLKLEQFINHIMILCFRRMQIVYHFPE